MRRRMIWLTALVGVVWLYLRRGVRRPQPVVRIPPATDPAEELRRKLEETKERADEAADPDQTEPAPEAEVPAAAQPADADELDAKRREVHERARSAADEMRRTSTD